MLRPLTRHGTPMTQEPGSPFETLESAHGFVCLLREAVDDAYGSILDETALAQATRAERRLDALRVVDHKLNSLRQNVLASLILLNDLRTLRRLLLGERQRTKSERERGAVVIGRHSSLPLHHQIVPLEAQLYLTSSARGRTTSDDRERRVLMSRHLTLLLCTITLVAGCSRSPERSSAASPTAPSAAEPGSLLGPTSVAPGGVSGKFDVSFPPRNESFDFRNQLETKYQTGLGRAAAPTFVDREGEVVWTQEYMRYRTNGCDHATATQRVNAQIDGQPAGRRVRRTARRLDRVSAAHRLVRFPAATRIQVPAVWPRRQPVHRGR